MDVIKRYGTLIKIVFFILALSIFACQDQYKTDERDADSVAQIDSLLTSLSTQNYFNGNILVAKKDKIIYKNSFGFMDASQQEKLNDNSIFNTGSIAKEYNGVAIMMLQERGLLSIDDVVSTFELGLPKWSNYVTVRHLLNYTSGIPPLDIKDYPKNDEEAWEILRGTDSLLFEPGSDFYYDNSNVFLQKRIIEKVASQTFEEFVMENIVKPLRLTNTVFDPSSDYPNLASCYDRDKTACPNFEFISGWPYQDIGDLYKWVKALNSNELISQKSFSTLITNPYVKYKTSSLGEYFENDQLHRHNGTALKFRSLVLNDLRNDVVVILLVNTPTNLVNIGYKLLDMVLARPYESTYKVVRESSLQSVDKGIESYGKLKKDQFDKYRFGDPSDLNRVGYELYRKKESLEEVIKYFKFAVTQHPDSPNLHDSLAEMYFNNKQYDLALMNYEKAIELGGTAGNAKKMIEKIELVLQNNTSPLQK